MHASERRHLGEPSCLSKGAAATLTSTIIIKVPDLASSPDLAFSPPDAGSTILTDSSGVVTAIPHNAKRLAHQYFSALFLHKGCKSKSHILSLSRLRQEPMQRTVKRCTLSPPLTRGWMRGCRSPLVLAGAWSINI